MAISEQECYLIPEIHTLSVGSTPVTYVMNLRQTIGILLNKPTKKLASELMHSFLKGKAGRSLERGGDLAAAYDRDEGLTAKIYTHGIGASSKPSYYVTMDGLRPLVELLIGLYPFEDFIKQKLFALCTINETGPAQLILFIKPASRPAVVESDVSDEETDEAVMPASKSKIEERLRKKECEAMRLQYERDVAHAQLQFEKDMVNEKLKKALLESAHKDELLKLHLQLKDEQLTKEQMKLEMERKQWELERVRLERDGDVKKQAKASDGDNSTKPKKLDDARCIFSHLVSSAWPNSVAGVNHFVDLISTDENAAVGPIDMLLAPRMQVRMAQGLDEVNSFYFLLFISCYLFLVIYFLLWIKIH